jgi:K+-sensing histidine kinase KdpD
MLPDFRVRQRDYFLEIAQALTQDLDLDSLLGRILDHSIEMLAGHAGLIALRSEEGGWQVPVSRGLTPSFLRFIHPYLAKIPETEDAEQEELPEIGRLLTELTEAASMGRMIGVGLPLVARRKVVGVIFVFRSYPTLFSVTDRSLLASFANQAAIAVQNAQYYTLAVQEKQRMDALLNSAADGILILNPDLRIKLANDAFARMVSQECNNLEGRPHDEVIRWDKPPQDSTLEKAVADGWPLSPHANLYVEGDLSTGDQKPPLPVGITYAPLFSEQGKLLNIFATIRDITRFRQAEELKSTFISIISHELKTPVALIKGYVSTLRREDATWDRKIVQESLEVIEEEADHLSGLIENMLDASRLQAGGLSIKRSDINLPAIAARLAKKFQTQTTAHQIVVDFPPNFPVVLADETRVEQVISNLISNSMKYAPDGKITVSGQVRPDSVIICVSDEGPGIAPEDVPHVFDRFYRARDMAKVTKGAGLGLYLARAIVEAHNGKMWVDAGTDRGARIYFSLPFS